MAAQSIQFSGFNGYDFGKVIDAIIQQESQPMTETQNRQKAVQDKDSALVQLGSQIGNLETSANKLINASAFTGVAATSSDETILKTSLGDGAIPGHYDLVIDHLAKAQVTTSTNGYANATDTAADGGSISFTVNGVTTDAIEVTSATTLSQLKDLINDQGSSVVASVVNSGTNKRLVVASRDTGASEGFTVNNTLVNSAGAAVAFAAGQSATSGNAQDARDAAFTLNGLDIASASIMVTDAIPGITVTLVKAGTGAVDVSTDYSDLKDTLKTFVSDYNKLRTFYTQQSALNPVTGEPMPLGNDSVMRHALSDIRSTLLGSNSNGGRYSYLSQIGLEFSQSGNLQFVDSTFNTAMASNAVDVKKLFQGTASTTGVFNNLKTRLQSVDATAGAIKITRKSIDTTLKNYRDRISAQQMRLDVRRAELTKMYAAADTAMSKLNQATSSLSSIATRTF